MLLSPRCRPFGGIAVGAADKGLWRPAFVPPPFKIANAAAGNSAGAKLTPGRIRLEEDETSGDTAKFVAIMSIAVSGSFYEPFELQNYPFDSQPVGIQLESAKPMPESTVTFTAKTPVRFNVSRFRVC